MIPNSSSSRFEARKQEIQSRLSVSFDAHFSRFPCDQGQIRNRCCHQGLKQRLRPPKVARLTHAQLNHPRQAVLTRLAQALVFLESGCAGYLSNPPGVLGVETTMLELEPLSASNLLAIGRTQ